MANPEVVSKKRFQSNRSFELVYQVTFVLVVTISTLLWFQGNTWGQPVDFHPDEQRYLVNIVNEPAIPFWTLYGRWPIYAQRLAAWLLDRMTTDVVLARQISTLVSVAGLVFAGLAAKEIAGWAAALTTTALLSGAPLIVQNANFFTTDTWLWAGLAGVLFFAVRVVNHGSWRDSIFLGLVWGLATGSKLSGLFVLPTIILAYLLGRSTQRWRRLLATIIVGALITLAGQPTLFVYGMQDYVYKGRLLGIITSVANQTFIPSYALQYFNTPPWTYYVTNLLVWGAGPALLLVGGLAGIVLVVRLMRSPRAWRANRDCAQLLVISSALIVFYLTAAGQYAKPIRYAMPLLPPLAILGGWLVALITRSVREPARFLGVGCIVCGAMLPGLAFLPVHQRPDTRLEAAVWLDEHAGDESTICHEPDVGYAVPPIGLGGPAYASTALHNYRGVLLDWGLMYSASDFGQDHGGKLGVEPEGFNPVRTQAQQKQRIQEWLSACDWVILSDRFGDPFLPMSVDFEAISTFYRDMLADRQPDFRLAAEFRSLPGIMGLSIDDRSSELTFRSMDHPTIWIFQRR